MIQGSGWLGSKQMEVSVANINIIPNSPSNWSVPYSIYRMSFNNEQDCSVIINDEFELFLQAGQGFEMDEIDRRITSFKIKQNGISYNWIAAY